VVDISPIFAIGIGCAYNTKSYSITEHDWTIDLSEIYVMYIQQITVPVSSVFSPYFNVGLALKFGLFDFPSDDKNNWHFMIGQGFKIKPVNHLVLAPEVNALIAMTPELYFHGIFLSMAVGYEF